MALTSTLTRGLIAGAAGTVVINLVTNLDMVLRRRPASDLPARAVESGLGRAGLEVDKVPGWTRATSAAAGQVSGSLVGLGIGVAASLAHRLGLRAPAPLGGVALGAAAMVATDLPSAAWGLTDPREWSAEDWAADVIPHLAYGLATHRVLTRLERDEVADEPRTHAGPGLLLRSAALGTAAGSRASTGLVAALAGGRGRRLLAAALVAAEMAGDKAPSTPSRLAGAGVPARLATASVGATALADRERAWATLPVLAGMAGAAAGAFGGAAWRETAATRMPDWQAALLEDAAALGLTAFAVRPRRQL